MASTARIEVTATCPVGGCSGTNAIVVYGEHGDVIHRNPTCPTCGDVYTAAVTITATGAVVEDELT